MDDTVIQVRGVSKNFALPHERSSSIKEVFVNPFRSSMHKNVNTQHALKDISFEIKKGEFFGIVGRNGSGKSTLLKLIAGIYQPTKGSVEISGKLVPFIELGVGFNPELTGRQNVYLNGALLGFSEKEIAEQYDDIVDFAELKDFMDQKLKNYSSGMQVRLAFSMAVRAKADILLIDEVLAVGDADFQRKCFEYFGKLKREEKTVVFVSHDMEAVRKYCDRAVLIDASMIKDQGAAEKIAQSYTRLFSGAEEQPPENNLGDKRWGSGVIILADTNVRVGSKYITIKQSIRAKKSVEGCIVGVRLRDAQGDGVLGSNTKLERVDMPSMKAGEKKLVTWRIDNILSDGMFTVDSAIHLADEITVSDWLDDAAQFTVKKARNVPYSVDPGFDVVVGTE